jgi:hypothetical protein
MSVVIQWVFGVVPVPATGISIGVNQNILLSANVDLAMVIQRCRKTFLKIPRIYSWSREQAAQAV